MQRAHEDEHTSHTPPPPYTPVADYRASALPPPLPPQQQYHAQNPYPAPVAMTDDDYRLAQKLQDEEYAMWADRQQHQQHQHQQQQHHQPQHQHQCQHQHHQPHHPEYPSRSGEPSTGPQNQRPPVSSVSDHYQYNNPYYQNGNSQQRQPVIYASPNQPPLPYSQAAPYANGNGTAGTGGSSYYGSMNQGYYPAQSHPFYNAPYYPYQQGPQQHRSYREAEEEDMTSGCLNGLLAASVLWCFCSLCEE